MCAIEQTLNINLDIFTELVFVAFNTAKVEK